MIDLKLALPQRNTGGVICRVQELLANIPEEEDRAAIHDAVLNPEISALELVKFLAAQQFFMSKDTVYKHRAGICTRCNRIKAANDGK